MNININEYPENASPLELARYQVAVMEAFEKGAQIECYSHKFITEIWELVSRPTFYWRDFKYRVAKPKIAEGHNPTELTEDQVGIKDGWRLLSGEELKNKNPNKNFVEFFKYSSKEWAPSRQGTSFLEYNIYRTKRPPGYFLPKIKPWTFETCPKGYMLLKHCDQVICAAIKFDTHGINDFKWKDLIDLKFKYSLDNGLTWNFCGTEE